MSSVFDRFRGNNPLLMMQDVKRLQNNPAEIGQMLFNTGKINQEQYEHIKGMNSPKDICMYLMGQNENFRNAVQMMRTLQS
jgi:hypothetical protein